MAKISYESGTFARFFRAVKGRLVTRFGTGIISKHGYTAASIIGAHRTPMPEADGTPSLNAPGCHRAVQDLQTVVAITHAEAKDYKREYNRAVREGSLEEVGEADYVAHLERIEKRAEAERAKAKKLEKARKEAAKREDDLAKAGAAAAAKRMAGGQKAAATNANNDGGSGSANGPDGANGPGGPPG